MAVSPELVGVIIIGAGLAVSLIRNGKSSSKHYGEFIGEVKNIREDVIELKKGQDAIGKELNEQLVHCANISSEHRQQIKGLEGEVFGKRSKDRRK